jgi:hypothetical protein
MCEVGSWVHKKWYKRLSEHVGRLTREATHGQECVLCGTCMMGKVRRR